MKYIIIISFILAGIEIFLLKRRIARLEHNPGNSNNAQVRSCGNYGAYESRVYVIPDSWKKQVER